MATAESHLLIGIDFGTTFSGVAWAWSERPDEIFVITNWKSNLSKNSDTSKVPTTILYKNGLCTWGYDISLEEEPIQWFKLLLVDEADLQDDICACEQVQQARKVLRRHNKSEIDVVADYLRMLWKHSTEEIKKARGKAGVEGLPCRVVITIPAIWKPNAQERMREAAKRAGILSSPFREADLQLVYEPEAGALSVLADFQERPDIKPGDVFVVCDAGGGTVDIITYKVMGTDPIMLKEIVEGKGRLCGAIFPDKEFENFMKMKVRGKTWQKLSQSSIKSMVNNEWEHGIKRNYDGSDRIFTVSLPTGWTSGRLFHPLDDRKNDISAAQLSITGQRIRAIFGKSISGIRGLVNQQIEEVRKKEKKYPKAILLVGGFGACGYIQSALAKEHAHEGIEVMHPPGGKAWSAICRGAVIKAMTNSGIDTNLNVLISSRISRFNYGHLFMHPFRPGIDRQDDRIFDQVRGIAMATNQMIWYLKKGDDILDTKPVHFNWALTKDEPLSDNSFKLPLMHCESIDAPKRWSKEVKPLCDLVIRLQTPFEKLPMISGKDGKVHREINFEIEMTSTGTSLDFRVFMNGVQVGKSNVLVQYE
ncbi:actin-like ATPase domain-containing protein [Glonium stellatum]|uniref:Actin-like ATPase domain-containing protein n=1 Tax=Glonium stellatum TaxID=574774 RepID=A0A8E2F7V9_9PEZI|nr:actin-like ATPase domain-containing protein [Glonium stellatum]